MSNSEQTMSFTDAAARVLAEVGGRNNNSTEIKLLMHLKFHKERTLSLNMK